MAKKTKKNTPAIKDQKKVIKQKDKKKWLKAIDELLGLNSENIKLKAKSDDKDARMQLTQEEREALKHYEQGIQKTLDLIAPAGMQVRRNEIILNNLYSRTYFIHNWPSYIFPNWLSPTINYDAEMDISQFIYPVSNKAIMKMLRKKVAEMRSSIRMLEQRGVVRDPQLEAALTDAEELRDLLARGQEKLYQFGMYITIYGDDEEKLKKMETDIESLLSGKLVLMKPAMFQMEHAWTSTLPFGIDELEICRNMNTSPLSTSFPFTSSDLTDDHGILYGINRHNESLVIFDRFDMANANSTVFATSGAGKSFTVKLEILRSMMFGTDVFVIDPENEYVELSKTVGGTYIPLSLQSSFCINPFDLPKAVRGDDANVGEVLRSAAINLHGLFKLMLGELNPSEDSILDRAILDTYALKGIKLDTENPETIEPPTLHDLVDVLGTTDGGENMAKTLSKYTEGSYAGIFNKKTNVELDNQMVVFQIRDLEESLRPIAMYIALNFLWNRIRSDMKKRLLVIDEAWNLMQHEDSAKFLYGLVKRARKYYLGITTITQDVEDFVNSPYGKPIVTNAQMTLLLKQSPTVVDNLQKLFYLTDGEKYLLLNSDVGQGLLFAGNKHVAIQIVASPDEEKIITTNPEEVLKRSDDQKEMKQNVDKKVKAEETDLVKPEEVKEEPEVVKEAVNEAKPKEEATKVTKETPVKTPETIEEPVVEDEAKEEIIDKPSVLPDQDIDEKSKELYSTESTKPKKESSKEDE